MPSCVPSCVAIGIAARVPCCGSPEPLCRPCSSRLVPLMALRGRGLPLALSLPRKLKLGRQTISIGGGAVSPGGPSLEAPAGGARGILCSPFWGSDTLGMGGWMGIGMAEWRGTDGPMGATDRGRAEGTVASPRAEIADLGCLVLRLGLGLGWMSGPAMPQLRHRISGAPCCVDEAFGLSVRTSVQADWPAPRVHIAGVYYLREAFSVKLPHCKIHWALGTAAD